jgi:exopolyphosphatase/guanosine-5'-triphosphate,3'-diphosphate pyrophosphatase
MTVQRVASADIGSNTILLLIAEREPDGGWRRVADLMEITRISEGLDASGVLKEEPIARTQRALERFADQARREFGVEKIVLAGTAPFRRATNGREVAKRLGDSVDAEVVVVTGDEEADLVRLASRRAFPQLFPMLLVDIGGASTEVVFDGRDGSEFVSFDIGSVRLFERVSSDGTGDVAASSLQSEAEKVAHEALAGLADWNVKQDVIVGIAGTVTALAMYALSLEEWDHDAVHGATLSRRDVRNVANELFAMTLEERKQHPSLEPKRADVLPYGAVLLYTLMDMLSVEGLVVSDHGLRWGFLMQQTERT